jgi:YD repeat-containing protein
MNRLNREKRKQRLRVKANLERLETRWLMRANPILAVPVQPLATVRDHPQARAQVLALRLSAEIEQRLSHESLAASPLDLKDQKAEIRQFGPGDTMSWGTLRVLVRLEADGDHRFDLLYQKISTRFDHWAARHPVQASRSGVTAAPLQPASSSDGATSRTGTSQSGSSPKPLLPVLTPAIGAGPLIKPLDGFSQMLPCNCPDANNSLPPNGGAKGNPEPGGGTGASRSSTGGSSSTSGAGGGASSAQGGSTGVSYHLNSDASLVTGEYFQSHQGGIYQAQGVISGIDFQYSSLEAYPNPIFSALLTTAANSDSGAVTSITASLTVNAVSQGSAVTYDDVSLTNGETYMVQLQVTTVSTYATGIYPATLTITKYGGTDAGPETYTSSQVVVNDASSPYGAGWTIGGLQQITVGTAGSTLVITDGYHIGEEFTSSNGTSYAGPAYDLSSLSYNSSSHIYTRTYTNGTVVTFNSSGQETSIADRNGNTTDYAYVTSGAAAGALQTITDPVGLVTTLTYNPTTGKLATMIDPASHVTTFAFSGNDLNSIEDPTGAITTYGYNSSAQMTTETNPDNQTATVSYDSFGRMSSEKVFGGSGTFSTTAAEEVGLVAAGGTTPLVYYPSDFAGSITDADNATTSVTFDGMGGVTAYTDGRGNTTTITRNSQDLPISVTDPANRTTTYAYDADGNPTTITRADGSTESILYNDSFGVPTHVVDFNGDVTTYVLDSHGNVTQVVDPDGQSQYFTFNSAGQMLTDTDPRGATTTYTYNSLGRLTSITEPGTSIATIQYAYDSAGDVTAVTDEVGDTVTYTYNQMGQVLTEQNPVQAAAGKDVAFAYDAAGNLVSVTDALGNTTTYSYNARNEVISTEDPLDNRTTYGYDAEGNLVTAEDPRGFTTSYAYDADNDLVSVTDGLNNITTYVYDKDDEEINMIDPNGGTTTYTYNNLGEESTVILPGQTAPTTLTYDEDGNVLSVTDQLGDKTVYTYNNMNWLATETVYPNGTTPETTTYTYDYDGDLTAVTDGLSHTTSYAYDAMGDLISETDPTGGGTTTYGYDLAGRMTSLTDPDNNITTWTYTHADEVATEINPLGFATTYSYDLNGNVTSVIDPNSHQIAYSYDADGDETGETWVNPGGGSPLNIVTVTYDADGDVTKLQDANTNYQYTYNADDEVSTFADNGTTGLPLVTLTYAYDGDSNETSVSDSLGGLLTLTYDARDELTGQQFSGTGLSAEAVTYSYDNAGRLTGITRYSNLAETTEVAATAYSYDHANRMTGIVDSNSTGTTLVSYGCTYDAADRVTQEVRTWDSGTISDTLTYSYTNNNQLTGVTHTNNSFSNESFTWDSNGNETGTGYTTGTDNEQTASPGYTYTYDNAGEMTSETQTSTGDVWNYGYDFRGRMVTAVEKTSGGTTLESVTYTYRSFAATKRYGVRELRLAA